MPDTATCPKCSRRIRLRKDGAIPLHVTEVPRVFRYRSKAIRYLDRCPASGTKPAEWRSNA